MTKRKAPVDDQQAARELVQELHGLIKDGNALLRKMQDTQADLMQIAGEVFEERMEKEVKGHLEAFSVTIKQHTDDASEAVMRRFDTLYEVLVGEGKENEDIPSIAELVTLYREAQVYSIGAKVADAAMDKGLTLDDLLGLPTVHVGRDAALRLREEGS